ncbi:MAG: hypothetical protein U0641_07020 [Anaerolineae bacterium]
MTTNRQAVIDANVLVALVDSRDKWHRQADSLHVALKAQDVELLYLDSVLEVGIEAIVTFDMDFQQVSWLTTISDPNHIRG